MQIWKKIVPTLHICFFWIILIVLLFCLVNFFFLWPIFPTKGQNTFPFLMHNQHYSSYLATFYKTFDINSIFLSIEMKCIFSDIKVAVTKAGRKLQYFIFSFTTIFSSSKKLWRDATEKLAQIYFLFIWNFANNELINYFFICIRCNSFFLWQFFIFIIFVLFCFVFLYIITFN